MLADQLQKLYTHQRSGLMTNQTNKTFVQNYFTALSGTAKPEAIVNQYVDDADLKHHIELFEAAFPRYELIAEDMVAEDDKVAVRATFRGTQTGEFFGIPATGKEVTVSLMLIYRIANGKIVEHWMNADQLSLMQQLEAIPA
jgi:predicted ester cyclase